MKALIGTAVGILGLGGLVLAASGRTATPSASVVASDRASLTSGPTLVDCGEGRQALVHPSPSGTGASRVECVAVGGAQPMAVGMPLAQPFTAQLTAPAPAAVPAVVQERIVYRDRPVTRTAARRASTSSSSAASSSAPVYRDAPRQTRSWKKSAVIIGGATAGGAGLGAVLGGKSGAKKGAVVGLVGGTVYDIATRNK
jgi:hypothetical protein